MPDYRRWIRSLLVVPGIVLLSSCSLIWPDAPEPLPADRTVSLRIDAAAGVNTDSRGNSLPIRVCVFEISRDDWIPPGLYRNAPCDETAPDPVMIRQMQHILSPGESRRYSFEIPRETARWLLVAAEFQIPGKNKNTVLINTEVNKNSNVVVVVRERSLTQMKIPVSDKP
ncbi:MULTISPECIES: type VI secretion system lipoprotein TssJ [Morganella]|uniref:type VI secretion system lipoprotein TssJ n=1 Tax=Morganella TaxID=581 RepID=UPI0021CF0BB9|nr:type VI secretion system lipoprotein TssJ [Morganella morganii]MCU6375440.1 type VI secretion system lipoprotein TssJ [Morganella morganii]HEI9843831.1 type VI secretion system lipoprotein TssJ [Morganella morganii]